MYQTTIVAKESSEYFIHKRIIVKRSIEPINSVLNCVK